MYQYAKPRYCSLRFWMFWIRPSRQNSWPSTMSTASNLSIPPLKPNARFPFWNSRFYWRHISYVFQHQCLQKEDTSCLLWGSTTRVLRLPQCWTVPGTSWESSTAPGMSDWQNFWEMTNSSLTHLEHFPHSHRCSKWRHQHPKCTRKAESSWY